MVVGTTPPGILELAGGIRDGSEIFGRFTGVGSFGLKPGVSNSRRRRSSSSGSNGKIGMVDT
jgi:hypothetical protein